MIRINLLALTGFGNIALKTLINRSRKVEVLALYTRQETSKFPYYELDDIAKIAGESGIETIFIPQNGDWDIRHEADLNLVVTFHRILKSEHLEKGLYNINIHPSLLPSYKGPTPTNWQIQNGEKICGLTAHKLTDEIDAGPIIFQKAYPLNVKTDILLRKYLAEQVGEAVNYLIDNFPDYKEIKSEYTESYYPSFYKHQQMGTQYHGEK